MRFLTIALALLSTVCLSAAQDADLLLQVGEELPGLGRVDLLAGTRVDDSGSWAALLGYDTGCPVCGPIACMRDGVIVAEPGTTFASGYTIPANSNGVCALDLSAGGELILTILLAGGTRDLLWEGTLLLREGDALSWPGFPTGTTLMSLTAARVADGGQLALIGRANSPGMSSYLFLASALVDAGGIQSLDVVATSGNVIGQSGRTWEGNVATDLHNFDFAEDGRILWQPQVDSPFSSSTAPALFLDDAPLILPGEPGPVAGTRYSGFGTSAGFGSGSWAAQARLDNNLGVSVGHVLLRDGDIALMTGDACPTLAPATYLDFRPPIRPLDGGGLLFSGNAGGYLWGQFDLAGHIFLHKDHVDGLRAYLPGSSSTSYASPNGRWQIKRTFFGGFEGVYLLDRLGAPEDDCLLPTDAFEPNDTCGQAVTLAEGIYKDLQVSTGNSDWYRTDVSPGRFLSAHTRFDHAAGDINLRLWSGACGSLQLEEEADTVSSDERVFAFNGSGGPVTYWLEVLVNPGSTGDCAQYQLNINRESSFSCADASGPLEDAIEDGDSPETALPLAPGLYTDLHASRWDEDWSRISVAPGETLRVKLSLGAGSEPLLATLFEDANLHRTLANAFLSSSDATLTWSNFSSMTREVWLGIEPSSVNFGFQPGGCVAYDMEITSRFDGPGTAFCPVSNNSTGLPGLLFAFGSTSVAANSLRLFAFTLPDQPGIFLYGDGTQQIPLANGTLCVAAGPQGLFRFSPLLAVDGVMSMVVDFSMPPKAAGQITAGSTWNFQAWHRDPASGGGNADLTNAVALTFTP